MLSSWLQETPKTLLETETESVTQQKEGESLQQNKVEGGGLLSGLALDPAAITVLMIWVTGSYTWSRFY